MNTIEFGDCRATMRAWAAQGIKAQMCVTSPPYFGLRDYGTGTWEGGNSSCDHVVGEMRRGLGLATSVVSVRGGGHKAAETADIKAKSECPKCGATRVDQQIGLEETPEQFIAELVDVFRAVRDVLADDGTLWINMGDSYATSGGPPTTAKGAHVPSGWTNRAQDHRTKPTGDVKPKDLFGIPWMLAFALRADGWYLRQDIIWHKPNPMPESVTDRCTKAHEYVFLLSKSAKYFYDHEAVKEDAVGGQTGAAASFKRTGSKREQKIPGQSAGTHRPDREDVAYNGEKRNRRSVWTVATRPYKGAHFATFPPALIEPCILAGSRPGDIVLDPFMGSGTTAAVALQHGRRYLGCELNADYGPLQEQRIAEALAAIPKPSPQMDLIELLHADIGSITTPLG